MTIRTVPATTAKRKTTAAAVVTIQRRVKAISAAVGPVGALPGSRGE